MDERLRYEKIDSGPPHGFFVRSTASTLMDRPVSPPLPKGTVPELLKDVQAAVRGGARRVVVFTHGYNNPTEQAMKNARALYEARFKARHDTVFVAFLWPSEGGFRGANLAFARRLPALGTTLMTLGVVLIVLGLVRAFMHGWGAWTLGTVGALLVGLIGYVVFLRFAVYYRDNYRANAYGAPDLADLIRQLDDAVTEALPGERLDLSFIGHSMGAFVTTSAVRLLTDYFAPLTDEPLENLGRAFRLENLVLVSPDIPVQAIISKRLNFLATSLRRFHGRFLFSNGADVVLDPISTTVNSPVLPLISDKWNVRLGNLATDRRVPPGVKIVTDPDEYVHDLCTPHGELGGMLHTHTRRHLRGEEAAGPAVVGDKPHVPIAADNAFTIVDCTAFRAPDGRYPLSRGHDAPHLLARLWLFVLYMTGKIDTHSGYFQQPLLTEALARTAESGWDGLMLDDGGKWTEGCGVRVLRLEGH